MRKKSSLWGRQTFKEQVEEEEPAKKISIQENVLHQRKERMYFKEESSQHKILQINQETKLRTWARVRKCLIVSIDKFFKKYDLRDKNMAVA